MIVVIVVFAVLVLAIGGLMFSRRVSFGNSDSVDRLRENDPRAAAEVEARRSEHGLRGMGNGLGGGGMGGGGGIG